MMMIRLGIDLRRGQAAVETAIALTVFVFVVAALMGFANIFLEGLPRLSEVRTEAGVEALRATGGDGAGWANDIKRTTTQKTSNWRVGQGTGAYNDAWKYPCESLGDNSAVQTWLQTSAPFIFKQSIRIEDYDLDISLFGSDNLFPNRLTLKEEALMPVMGGTP